MGAQVGVGDVEKLGEREIEQLLEGGSVEGEEIDPQVLLGSGEVSMEEGQLEEEEVRGAAGVVVGAEGKSLGGGVQGGAVGGSPAGVRVEVGSGEGLGRKRELAGVKGLMECKGARAKTLGEERGGYQG